MNEAFQTAIDALKDQLKPLEEEVILKKRLINELCKAAQAEPMFSETELRSTISQTQAIRSDQFFGQPLATSVKFILQRRRAAGLGAVPLDALCNTLAAGGYVLEGKTEGIARRNVAITLSKNPAFMRIPNGDIGLAEWYPNAKRNKANGKDETAGTEETEETEETEKKTEAESADQLMKDIIEEESDKTEKSP